MKKVPEGRVHLACSAGGRGGTIRIEGNTSDQMPNISAKPGPKGSDGIPGNVHTIRHMPIAEAKCIWQQQTEQRASDRGPILRVLWIMALVRDLKLSVHSKPCKDRLNMFHSQHFLHSPTRAC